MIRIEAADAGESPEGPVARHTLRSDDGGEVSILSYGAILQAVRVPDRHGSAASVVLGFATLDAYLAGAYRAENPYFGAVAGRYANRIRGGRFVLDGREYVLAQNQGDNHLHGGRRGFDARTWDAEAFTDGGSGAVRLARVSPDGEEGYPGTVSVAVTYTWSDEHVLGIEYLAETDRPTVINLTNHSYFNLAGEGSGTIYDHELTLHASRYTPTDASSIPTGELAGVEGTPFDFRTPHAVGERIRDADPQLRAACGYDHNFVLDGHEPATAEPRLAAHLRDPVSGRELEVWTTQPAVQLYSGNFLDGRLTGAGGRAYRQSDGLCLETQHFPDSPHQPAFPSTVLRPGEPYRSRTELRFRAGI